MLPRSKPRVKAVSKGKSGGGSALPSMRWTLSEASVEFGIARKDLLHSSAIFGPADEEMTWGTRQIVMAIYDEQYRQRTKLLAQQSERFEINNAIKRSQLVDVDHCKAFFRYAALTLRP